MLPPPVPASIEVSAPVVPSELRAMPLGRKLKYERRGHQNELAGDVHSNATVPPPSGLAVLMGANSSTRTELTPVPLGLEVVGSANMLIAI